MKKFTVSAFVFLICTAALMSRAAHVHRAGGLKPMHQRCKCPRTHSKPPIPIDRILALKVFSAGPRCGKEEIIATLKKGPTCLNPNALWVISLKEEVFKRNDTKSNRTTTTGL